MTRKLEILTLPMRTAVLLFLLWGAAVLGNRNPQLDSQVEASEGGLVATYSRNGRPWRSYHDRDRDRKWDLVIDERSGDGPLISVDDDRDGKFDHDEDASGRRLSAWESSVMRARKTLDEFLHNPRHIQWTVAALMVYALLEFAIRWLTAGRRD